MKLKDSKEGNTLKKDKSGQQYHIPPFPSDLADVVSDKVFDRLSRWRNIAGKRNKSKSELQQFNDNTYTLFGGHERPKKPLDKGKEREFNRYDGPHDRDRTKRKHSSKDNHYVKSKKSRHVHEEESTVESTSSSEMSHGNYSSDSEESSQVHHKSLSKKQPKKKKQKNKKQPHRINDIAFSDTFFSSKTSIHGYMMFQLFGLHDSEVDYVYLMRRKSQVSNAFADFVRNVGAPNYMINDHAEEVTGEDWLDVARRSMIETFISEPHNQNQNPAERRGGALKGNLQLLFFNTPWASLSYWCYGITF